MWWMAGGAIERFESAPAAAKRELGEETGIIVENLEDLIPLNLEAELSADLTMYFAYSDQSLAWPEISRMFAGRYDQDEVDGVWWGLWEDAVRDSSVHPHVKQWLKNTCMLP